jgi:hypothetical protein
MAMFYSGLLSSPARFDHTGNFAGDGQLAETNAAQVEFANVAARPAAADTPVAEPDFLARRSAYIRGLVGGHPGSGPVFFRDFRCRCHVFLILNSGF